MYEYGSDQGNSDPYLMIFVFSHHSTVQPSKKAQCLNGRESCQRVIRWNQYIRGQSMGPISQGKKLRDSLWDRSLVLIVDTSSSVGFLQ